ncbi:hypothetical protein C8R43DRAFT_948001 [Mycena crocata]|nr:hypothetical protein C8R43DRAFT_948001 [Mycena crocata]
MWNKNLMDKRNGIVILDSIIGPKDRQDVKCASVEIVGRKDDAPEELEERGKNGEGRSERPDGGCKSESGLSQGIGPDRYGQQPRVPKEEKRKKSEKWMKSRRDVDCDPEPEGPEIQKLEYEWIPELHGYNNTPIY